MATQTTTGAAAQGAAAEATQGGTSQPDQGQTGSDEAFDKDRALATIQRQRESEADLKRQMAEAVRLRAEAERERDELRATTQTESERAINKARREGAAEVATRYQAQLRRSGVKTALVAAGVSSELLDLAAKDDAFADLEVTDDGEVKGLDVAVTALRKARPSLFAKPGDFGGGQRGGTPSTVPTMNELFRAAKSG